MTFQFESISAFFEMGGYGFYVWFSYIVTFLAVGILMWLSSREQKAILNQAKKELAREERLKKQVSTSG